jgi:hypothetical protein
MYFIFQHLAGFDLQVLHPVCDIYKQNEGIAVT